MNYLIVCFSDNKHYLLLSDDYHIQAYESEERIMDAFKGYTEAWRGGAERSASACIGMMNMQPVAIKAPEDVNDLIPFIISQQPYNVSGGAMGRGYKGILVSEDILQFKEFSIWDKSMVLGGIK